MPKGKCGGGKKLGVSCNFATEEAFIKHIRELCAGCYVCGAIDLKKNMEDDDGAYICSDCFSE